MGRVGRWRARQWGTGLGFHACLWWVLFLAVSVGDTCLYHIWRDKGYRMVDKRRGTGEILTEGHRVRRPQMAQLAQINSGGEGGGLVVSGCACPGGRVLFEGGLRNEG